MSECMISMPTSVHSLLTHSLTTHPLSTHYSPTHTKQTLHHFLPHSPTNQPTNQPTNLAGFRTLAILDLYSSDELGAALLPSKIYPSDHLAICADLELLWWSLVSYGDLELLWWAMGSYGDLELLWGAMGIYGDLELLWWALGSHGEMFTMMHCVPNTWCKSRKEHN